MAELADALDSGSSRGSSVKVQVLLPAPQKALKTLSFQGFLLFIFRCHTAVEGTHDLSILVPFQNADMAVGLLFLSLTNLISLLIILAVNSCVHFLYAPLPKQIL